MSGKTAAPWEIPFSEAADEPKTWPTLQKEQSERVAKLMKERFVTVAEHGAETTAASGELVKCTAGINVNLPAAAANITIGVLANGHTVEIKGGAAKIYGDYTEGVTSCKLVGYQHVVLQSDGTNYYIVSGETKRESKYVGKNYTKAEAEAGFTVSATRPAHMELVTTGAGTIQIGGVAVLVTGVAAQGYWMVWPGETVKANVAVETFSKLL